MEVVMRTRSRLKRRARLEQRDEPETIAAAPEAVAFEIAPTDPLLHYLQQAGGPVEIDKLKLELQKRTNRDVFIDITEVHKPELDAQLVSEAIALQLEKRVGFRRAMRKSVDSALRFGCKGIKVRVSGRLNGNEIARSEWYLQGRLPLHTLRADIDYGFTEAHTTYGIIGVKCWVYKGEILPQKKREPQAEKSVF